MSLFRKGAAMPDDVILAVTLLVRCAPIVYGGRVYYVTGLRRDISGLVVDMLIVDTDADTRSTCSSTLLCLHRLARLAGVVGAEGLP